MTEQHTYCDDDDDDDDDDETWVYDYSVEPPDDDDDDDTEPDANDSWERLMWLATAPPPDYYMDGGRLRRDV